MANRPSLDDYIDVAERLQDFKDAHPDGSLRTVSWSVEQVGDKTFIVYHAEAYRTPEDTRPGQGIAWEPFPGTTPYTRNSELMNAETAAWGRAIVALGLASNRRLASRQEVRARMEEQAADEDFSHTATPPPPGAAHGAAASPAQGAKDGAKGSLPSDPPGSSSPLPPLKLKEVQTAFVRWAKARGIKPEDAMDTRFGWLLVQAGYEGPVQTADQMREAVQRLTPEQADALKAELAKEGS